MAKPEKHPPINEKKGACQILETVNYELVIIEDHPLHLPGFMFLTIRPLKSFRAHCCKATILLNTTFGTRRNVKSQLTF